MKLSDILDTGTKVLDCEGGCDSCPRNLKDFVPATLTDSDIIIVGEAPGATEVETGEGFTGTSGKLLRRFLDKNGIENYSLTNTIHCRPPGNKDPTKKERSCCLNQFVVDEIKGHQNVLLTGKIPCETFFPNSTYSKMRGHAAWHADFPGQRFYTIFHPAYISRRQDKGPEFEEQIARFARIIKEDPGDPAWEIIRGDTPDMFDPLHEILNTKRFVLDIETDGLESWHPDKNMQSFSVCAEEDRAMFFHKSDPYWENALNILKRHLKDSSTFVIAHNAGFDLEWLESRLNINVRCQIVDTQALYYLLYMGEDFRKARMPSLKGLTADELDGYRYLVPQPHLCDDPELLAKYNTEDVIRTLQLFRKGFPNLTSKQKDLFLRVSSPSSLAVRRLSATGLNIDLDYAEELAEDLENQRDNEIQSWKEEDTKFNPDKHLSGDGFLKYVYEICDFPVIKRTEKANKPAADQDTIKELIRDHGANILEHRLEVQRIEKQLSTFVEPYRSGEVIDPFTDRTHPDYFNVFTRTGRLSSRNPNAQNISRDSAIRKLFSAPGDNVIIQSDYSQIELRIAGCLAGDENIIQAYQEAGDLHARTAQILAERAGRDKWTKKDRTNAKIINFSLVYSGDAGTVKRYAYSTFGINYTWDEAEKFHKMFFDMYPQLQPWHQEVIDDLRANRGYMETVMGHPRYLDGWDDPNDGRREHYERVAINTTCQSPAGYLTILTLYLVQQKLREVGLRNKGVKVVGSVHDSILYESPPEYVPQVIEVVEEAVREVKSWIDDWFIVRLVMDYEVGNSWGELDEIDIDNIEALDFNT